MMDSWKTRMFFAEASGYLKVLASPLEAIIEGGGLLRRGWGRLLKYKGGGSYDPDVDRGDLRGR